MHAVRAEAPGERHAVVDDEGDVRVGANALQGLRQPRELMLVDVLDPQLERRRDARLQRRCEPAGKRAADLLWADQIEPRRLDARRRRKVDRVEIGLAHRQAGTLATDAA